MLSTWQIIWKQFQKSWVGLIALGVLLLFLVVGIYAPLFACSKPLLVSWEGHFYFPLLRFLFYKGFYTKPIDIFFNLLMFMAPCALLGAFFFKSHLRKIWLISCLFIQISLFIWIMTGVVKDPERQQHGQIKKERLKQSLMLSEDPLLASFSTYSNWKEELKSLSRYSKLNLLLKYRFMEVQQNRLAPFTVRFAEKTGKEMPTLHTVHLRNLETQKSSLKHLIATNQGKYQEAQKQLPDLMHNYRPFSQAFLLAKHGLEVGPEKLEKMIQEASLYREPLEKARLVMRAHQKALADLAFMEEKENWLLQESKQLRIWIAPLIRSFHWEEDAGGSQGANQFLPWWELTRVNRKDLIASLIFGIRVSIVVGLCAVGLALLIGIPLGLISGYFAGKTDLVICRFIEMWEAMPTFFMLLLIIAITQTKSIFIVIAVLAVFGWTAISRFIRSEVLKQRKLSYVLACHSLGYTHLRIMFSHILPNALPPILTLLPFSIMAAITSEAGLSFLGLGEEGSTSWGVLMDEGRSVFPAESYLLWPPAILLTLLLISIALVGDRLRDALDPKMRS